MTCETQLCTKLQGRIDRAWTAHNEAKAVNDRRLMRLHAADANEMAELIEAIEDGTAEWARKIPLTS